VGGGLEAALLARSTQAIQAIQDEDFATLAGLAHPALGLRFSPYGYVRQEDQRFLAAQSALLPSDPTIRPWGNYDGLGKPIQLAFSQYYERFVYDVDFARPQFVGFNVQVGQGNTLNNIAEFYPGAVFVEYHFSGFDPQYSGMDWRSLRLVFVAENGIYYLAGIVHDEWTI
jgi:hypothetical protein